MLVDNCVAVPYHCGMNAPMTKPPAQSVLSREIADYAVKRTASFTADLVCRCPAPTRAEIHKILAMQSYMLNEYGLSLISLSRLPDERNKKAVIDAGLKLIAESRRTMAELLKDSAFDKATAPPLPEPEPEPGLEVV